MPSALRYTWASIMLKHHGAKAIGDVDPMNLKQPLCLTYTECEVPGAAFECTASKNVSARTRQHIETLELSTDCLKSSINSKLFFPCTCRTPALQERTIDAKFRNSASKPYFPSTIYSLAKESGT